MTGTCEVGVMGLGKLGLPLALVLDRSGCLVTAYDPDPRPAAVLSGNAAAPTEPEVSGLLGLHRITVASDPKELVRSADVIFVVVPTPHPDGYAGDRPLYGNNVSSFPGELTEFDSPGDPVDFEYGYLIQAVRSLSRAAWELNKKITIAVVSTVMPGTVAREIKPVCGSEVTVVYAPSLIALGSVVHDLQNPEFVIIGADRHEDAIPVCEVISKVHGHPFQIMDVESAELTKIAYNTFTSMKIVFGNTVMELAHKTGADCDKVTEALSLATTNLMSGRYLKGGMGGGGYCHPRDLVAASWLCRRLEVRADPFFFLSRAREFQSAWLADTVEHWSKLTGNPIVLLGEAYKAQSDLTGGSPARLLANQLAARSLYAEVIDPHTQNFTEDGLGERMNKPAVYVISTDHLAWHTMVFPRGSVVIDPHGKIKDQTGVTVVRIGRRGQ